MIIHNVVGISNDADYIYIETGVTLDYDTIRIAHDIIVLVIPDPIHRNHLAVALNLPEE